jgi:hypothetical protein
MAVLITAAVLATWIPLAGWGWTRLGRHLDREN